MAISIGIDLGTTNSCAAIMDGASPRVITTEEGAASIPSVFAVDDEGKHLVGATALAQAQENPLGTIQATKRLIGRNFHSKSIDQTRQVFTYEMVEGTNEEVMVQVKDNVFTLEQISAAILQRIKTVAEINLGGPVDRAVITVPAYFNERQRASVRDLGGGTFDISIIDIKGSLYEVVATGGDTFLGGVDFDDRVMQYILEAFHEAHRIDLSFDRVAVQRIRDAAENAKIALSADMKTRIDLPAITHRDDGSPIDIQMELTRPQLEQLTLDLVQRTVDTCRRIFEEAATSPREVDEILLVGGQSRMPLVQRAVGQMQGRPPNSGLDPEMAVGLGAAIMAKASAHPAGADVTLRDVLPIPIGTYSSSGHMHVLFAKNERLPARRSRTLTTSRDGQHSIMLRIYQGEHDLVDDNDLLGTFVFSGIRLAKAGEVQLEVSFDLDAEGNLRISAEDMGGEDRVDSYMKLDPSGRPPPPRPKEKRKLAGRSELGQDDEDLPPLASPAPISMPMSSLAHNIEGATAPESSLNDEGAAPGIWTTTTQAEAVWDDEENEDELTPPRQGFIAWLFSPFRR